MDSLRKLDRRWRSAWTVGRYRVEWKHVRDEVVPVLVLLETAEGHLGAGDELLGVLEVVELKTLC